MEKVVFLEEKTPDVGDTFIRSSTFKKKKSYMLRTFSNERVFPSVLDLKIAYVTQTKSTRDMASDVARVRFVICKAGAAAQPNTNAEGIG